MEGGVYLRRTAAGGYAPRAVTTPRLRPCLLALAAASSLLSAAPARADEAARRKMMEKLHPGAATSAGDQDPVPAPPLEPPSRGEPSPARPSLEQAPAAEPLPQKPRAA